MFGVKALYGSVQRAMNPCLKSKSILLHTTLKNASRFRFESFDYLAPVSSFCISTKCNTVDWHPENMLLAKEGLLPTLSREGILPCKSDTLMVASARPLTNSRFVKDMLHSRCTFSPWFANAASHHRGFSSHAGGTSESSENKATNGVGNEWLDMLNNSYQSAKDAAVNIGEDAKKLSDEVRSYIQHVYDSHPYVENVIIPVGGTLSATVLAWFFMPRILRKFHKYTKQSPFSLLSGSSHSGEVSYQTSVWSALEDPARYLVTFMAFSQLAAMITPSALQYLPQAWRGAVVLSFIWFLHRWKTNMFARAIANQVAVGLDRDTLLALEKVSSFGLLFLGLMAVAEACGVAVQSILTVGGIGGVATAFAARDILGNLLSGLSLQFSKPFSVGDNIKAGSIEGQVVEMGLTATSLINPEKFPVIVPNSLFSSQVIVNKSRAEWRAAVTTVPITIDDLEKVPSISEEITSMLTANPKVFLEKDAPYCFLSRIESSFAELTLGFNLRKMRKDEFCTAQQEIILEAARIIRRHGAQLGNTQMFTNGQL